MIQKVCKKVSNRFTFDIYDAKDIEQEAFIICMSILNKWNGSNLENWLTVSVSNRLRNLIKKNGSFSNNKFIQEEKERISNASNINEIPTSELPIYELNIDEIDNKILIDRIEENLTSEQRKDYLKLKTGKLSKHKKDILLDELKDIVEGNHGQG